VEACCDGGLQPFGDEEASGDEEEQEWGEVGMEQEA